MIQNSHRLKKNNFDLLRLLFAGTVCLVHAYQLSGFQELEWIALYLSSEMAVKSFFVVSGFLIFMSYERSSSLKSYAVKRVRRIYPAYLTIVILFAILLVSVSSYSLSSYFSFDWLKYLIANITFLNFIHPTLPGVFESNIFSAVNGALWTIKIEVMFYLSVPIFSFLFRKLSHIWVIALVYCFSVGYAWGLAEIAEQTQNEIYKIFARQLPGQLSYFMAGAFLYYFLPLFERYVGYFLFGSIFLLVANKFYQLPLLEPLALAIVVIFFGLFLYIRNFGKYGDFSYGIYILHFPIIQILVNIALLKDNPWFFLLAVVFLTLAGAIILWHLVEKQFLFRRNHYIVSTITKDMETPNTHALR